MSEPKPTRPDPGETQYGSQVPPPPPLQDNPRLVEYFGQPRHKRSRSNARTEQRRTAWLRRVEEYKRQELRLQIVELEHSTNVVPLGSDPDHCETCVGIVTRLKQLRRIRKVDA